MARNARKGFCMYFVISRPLAILQSIEGDLVTIFAASRDGLPSKESDLLSTPSQSYSSLAEAVRQTDILARKLEDDARMNLSQAMFEKDSFDNWRVEERV